MRTIKKGLVMMAAIVLVASGLGFSYGVEPNVKIRNEGSKEFALFLNGISSKNAQISIKDEGGSVLYSENLKASEFSKKFNLKALPQGEYSMEIEDEVVIKTLSIAVSNEEVVVSEKITSKTFKPFFKQNAGVIDVTMLSLNEKITALSILDENGKTIYTESVNDQVIQKRFNLSQLAKGSYTFMINSEQRSFFETINLN